MFWNSLNRKGKVAGTAEKEMDVVVAIHNNMNESTWSKVLEWEDVVSLNCFANSSDRERSESPRLLKFIGRPTDISPKGKKLFGCKLSRQLMSANTSLRM